MKQRLLLLSVFLIPLLFFASVEIILRVAGYGGDLNLVVKKEVLGKEFYAINRNVGRRYFPPSSRTIPEPSEDLFRINKGMNTLRIFCLGESTMAGFPYEYNATAPSMLRARLEQKLPEREIEVVNVGMSAVGSYVVKDLLKTLVLYEPDLFILYLGHNEFYGVFGVASTAGSTTIPWLTDLYLNLLNLKTFLAARDLFTSVASGNPDERKSMTMMEELARDQAISHNSDLYVRCREIYASNLAEISGIAGAANVPLLVTTPVSNLADMPPFLSVESDLSEVDRSRFNDYLTKGEEYRRKGKSVESIEAYRSAVRIDSGHAAARYWLGKTLAGAGAHGEALSHLRSARDLDGLRFRMSSDFLSALIRQCNGMSVPVAHVDSAYASRSPHGIIGEELILEHLHPNIEGYALMADTWADAIYRENLLTEQSEWNMGDVPPASGVTPFDYAVGRVRVAYLTHRWPFQTRPTGYRFNPRNKIEEVALRYVQGVLPWQSARYELADHFVRQREFGLARQEAFAVSRVLPFSYEPRLRIGDYYFMEGRQKEALRAYRECLEVEENPFAYSKIGLIQLQKEEFAEVRINLEKALAMHEESAFALPSGILAFNNYLLGYSYIRLGDIGKGKDFLRRALTIDPQLEKAEKLLQDLEGIR